MTTVILLFFFSKRRLESLPLTRCLALTQVLKLIRRESKSSHFDSSQKFRVTRDRIVDSAENVTQFKVVIDLT